MHALITTTKGAITNASITDNKPITFDDGLTIDHRTNLTRYLDFNEVPHPYNVPTEVTLRLTPDDVHTLIAELLDEKCSYNDLKAMRLTATELRRTIKATCDALINERQDW